MNSDEGYSLTTHSLTHSLTTYLLEMTYQADYEAGVRRHTERLLRRALADNSIDQNKTRTDEALAPSESGIEQERAQALRCARRVALTEALAPSGIDQNKRFDVSPY